MELNELKNAEGAVKNRKRVGRGPGSGTGKTSGKGHKGQQARAGYRRRPQFEGGQMPMHMRLPKRGFNHSKRRPFAIINVELLENVFEAGAEVSTEILVGRHLVAEAAGGVKVLGKGELTKALHVKVQAISPGAQTKIEAAGGSVTLVALGGTPGPQPVASSAAPAAVSDDDGGTAAEATEE